jgi:nucleoside-diphosphate-sugar epimerase
LKIVVTGGLGRFGRVVVPRLIARGDSVGILDRVDGPDVPTGVAVDIDTLSDVGQLAARFAGCDGVVHLAAIPHPLANPPAEVYANNTLGSFNVLLAAAQAGVRKVVLASSINAIGGAYSRRARYDYLPVDESHPTYNEDAYSLSKWVMEAQADMITRLHPDMTVSSLRIHGLNKRSVNRKLDPALPDIAEDLRPRVINHLWGMVDIDSAAGAVLCALDASFAGHEVFYIVSDTTVFPPHVSSRALAAQHFPEAEIRGELRDNAGFFNCDKARRMLGWVHNHI